MLQFTILCSIEMAVVIWLIKKWNIEKDMTPENKRSHIEHLIKRLKVNGQ